MCQNAEKQVGNLLVAEEPMVVNLLTELGVVNTPTGQSFITLFDDAAASVQGWKPGTAGQEVLEVVQTADKAFDDLAKTLPIPAQFTSLADIIAAGLTAAITLIAGNSQPAGTPAGQVATPQALEAHQKQTMEVGLDAVEKKCGYKPSHFEMARAAVGDTHVGANAAKSRWNKDVDALGPQYTHMKV